MPDKSKMRQEGKKKKKGEKKRLLKKNIKSGAIF